MCLIIAKPAGKVVPTSHLRNGYKLNPHGAGYAFVNKEDGKLTIKKGFFSFNSFLRSYEEDVLSNENGDFLLHFRWATCSSHNEVNCHPWRINEDFVMVHNGILPEYSHFRNGLSDTGNFTDFVLKPLFNNHSSIWDKPYFIEILSQSIGAGNKIVVMDKNGKMVIYNEGEGQWEDGIWYSNNGY